MLFNIPQFIDKEDKIVGPLTAKQIGWMFGAGAILMGLWTVLDKTAFIISAIPIVALTGAFAFYRPYNQSLIKFIVSVIRFIFNQKTYLWERMPEMIFSVKKTQKNKLAQEKLTKNISAEKIAEISNILDTNK